MVRHFKKIQLLTAILGVSLFAACTTVPLDDKKADANSDKNASTNKTADSGMQDVKTIDMPNQDNKDANPKNLARSVYFDLDSYVVKDEFRKLLVEHGKVLSANKALKVVIEGNTDERGSREYNLALGQKRAEVVRKALLGLGVTEDQIEAISFGEDKPKNEGHDEAAWGENRRSDIVYK